ncbi:MAG: hypothetical protein ABI206_15710, partial [Antricoccus sp.]
DRAAFAEASAIMQKLSLTGSAAQIQERVAAYAKQGVTEIAYQPAGADIPGELERFIAAVHG